MKRFLHGLVVAVLLSTALAGVAATSAQAGECPYVDETTGKLVYSCEGGGSTDPGSGDGGGDSGGGPTCDKSKAPYTEFCDGTAACWGNNPAAVKDPKELEGTPKPDEDANVAYKSCRRADGSTYDEWYWSTAADGPSLNELAQRAFGALRVPVFAPTFNPPGRSYVNLDTWWWAQGASDEEIIGSSALGVVAIAAPNRLEVDPGDGSNTIDCAFSTTKSDACTYMYRRGSNRGSATAEDGSRAYPARMRLVYDVRFERNGAPLALAGLPTSLSSPWRGTAISVREIQTVVQPNR